MAKEEIRNFDELKNDINGTESQSESSNDTTVIQAGDEPFPDINEDDDDSDEVGLIIDESDIKSANTPTTQNKEEKKDESSQKGFVMDNPVINNKNNADGKSGVQVGALANPDRVDDIKKTMDDMDKQIEVAKARYEEHKANMKEEEKHKRIEQDDTIQVIIDKSGLGTFTFTEEEKERIEKAKKIRLIEVEDKELKTLKIKRKVRKRDEFKILKKNFDKSYSPVLALASGYTCKMKNVSAVEAIKMYQRPGNDTANSILEKWSLIYDKLVDVSRGEFTDIEDFLSNTAFNDYEHFVYAMIASSYPEDDVIEFNCDKKLGGCGKNFSVDYKNTTMIRQDLITDDVRGVIAGIINNAPFVDKAREHAEKAPVHTSKRFFVDDTSGIIVEIYIPSVRDMMINYFEELQDNDELMAPDKRDLVILAQGIKSIFIPDYESNDGSFFQAEGAAAIVETLSDLTTPQLQVITNKILEFTTPYTLRYGLEKVVCPHCKHDFGQYTFNLDSILFQRVQQQVMTEIE